MKTAKISCLLMQRRHREKCKPGTSSECWQWTVGAEKPCTFQIKFAQWEGTRCIQSCVSQNAPSSIPHRATWTANTGLPTVLGFCSLSRIGFHRPAKVEHGRSTPEGRSWACPVRGKQATPDHRGAWSLRWALLGPVTTTVRTASPHLTDTAGPLSHGARVVLVTRREAGGKPDRAEHRTIAHAGQQRRALPPFTPPRAKR